MPRSIVIPSAPKTRLPKGARSVKPQKRVNERRESDWADSGKVKADGTPLNPCRGCSVPIRTFLSFCSECKRAADEFWAGLRVDLGLAS